MNEPRSPLVRLRSACLLLFAVLAGAVFHAGHAAEPAADRQTLELPKLTVTDQPDLPKAESWRYAKVAGFDVLSNASDRASRTVILDFVRFKEAIQCVWPRTLGNYSSAYLVLATGQNSINQTLLSDTSLVRSLHGPEQVAFVLNPANQRVAVSVMADFNLEDTSTGHVLYEADYGQLLYREYISLLFQEGKTRVPVWFEEGILQIVMAMERTDKWLIFGRVDTNKNAPANRNNVSRDSQDASGLNGDTIVGETSFNRFFARRSLIPFNEFLREPRGSELTKNPLGKNPWAKQSYAFVHFCLFGDNLRHQEHLAQFVTRLAHEPLSETLFKECFGMGYADMGKALRSYTYYTRHKYQRYDLTGRNILKKSDIVLIDATATQVGVIKGDVLLLADHPQAAYAEYRNAYRSGGRTPELFAGLATTVPDEKMAHKFTREAVKGGSSRPSVYINQASQRLEDFRNDPGPDGRLTQVQLVAVLSPLFKARSLPPRQPELYKIIAEAWALSSVVPHNGHLAVLNEGVRLFPRDSDLIHRTALLYRQVGAIDTATSVTKLGLRFATEPGEKSRLEELLATLSPPAH